MKLEQLYTNFTEMDERGQLAFVRNYRNKRFMDLQNYNVGGFTPSGKKIKTTSKKVRKRKATVPMPAEQLEALKNLGYTSSQIAKMRK